MELARPRAPIAVGYRGARRAGSPARLTVSGARSYHSISQLLRPPWPAAVDPSRGVIDGEASAAVLDGLKARLDQLLREARAATRGPTPRACVRRCSRRRWASTRMRKALAATEQRAGGRAEAARRRRAAGPAGGRGAGSGDGRPRRAVRGAPSRARGGARAQARGSAGRAGAGRARGRGDDRGGCSGRRRASRRSRSPRRGGTSKRPAPSRPDEDERLQADADRQRRESAIEAQLAYLKKKLGKQ